MMVLITAPRGKTPPAGKRADVVLQFDQAAGDGALMRGLELHGLAVWERKDGSGLFVTLPGREYTDNDNKKKTFDFLRYTESSDAPVLENLKTLILEQYVAWSSGR